ncbi:hypothetical protein ERO13_A02G146601v2 [Gossypium hirsutum]|uniref:Uncharacterized protein n=1 Tax=Gossypium mustelinum TaxID=34275 RepID=A0A5D3AA33_GOSMU|nr:hypothetical protein ERO13_A02G146601v2 [Gossypium hirsutum]KAG4212156.1 hypothetical protein ERO13_A02G146601v2 [Gossypium hirsutum]TYJ47109.1 hypothetical protein E1A91_A02G164800v1 [Gossypium mustelinum]
MHETCRLFSSKTRVGTALLISRGKKIRNTFKTLLSRTNIMKNRAENGFIFRRCLKLFYYNQRVPLQDNSTKTHVDCKKDKPSTSSCFSHKRRHFQQRTPNRSHLDLKATT